MDQKKLLQILNSKIEKISGLERLQYGAEEFEQWRDSVKTLLRTIFGEKSPEFGDFNYIHYIPTVIIGGGDFGYTQEDHEAYLAGLRKARSVLKALVEKIELFGYPPPSLGVKPKPQKGNFVQKIYLTQTQIQNISQKIDFESLNPAVKQKVEELLKELSQKEKDKSKIQEIIKWLADRAIDVLIAIIMAKGLK